MTPPLKSLLARGAAVALVSSALALAGARPVLAADQWIEVKSAHFVVLSNAGEGNAKTLAWQLEQIRSAISALWPWAKVDLNKPLMVFALKDEAALKAFAPTYWERKGGVRPATVWVGGVDQHYLAIRTDVEADDTLHINPYVTSYFSYVSLILQQSAGRPMPMWFSRGLAGVMSNTIVRESKILLGPPIPWHLQRLGQVPRFKLPALLKMTRTSPEFLSGEGQSTFDAESWALVHYLMFGEGGARWLKLDRFAKLVAQGTDPDVAFREVLGPPEDLASPFDVYISRNLFSFRQVNVDVAVKREGFTVRQVPLPEATARRALFHAAMRRPDEARRAIDDARKMGAAPETFVAEGLLLDASGQADEAKAAYARAVDAGSTSPYAYYRLASLMWRTEVDHDTLLRIETILNQAVTLNNRDASAYALLGDARSALGTGDPMAMVLRAIALDPAEPHHRLTAARVLWRARKYDEALKYAQAALSLSDTDDERSRATEMIDSLTKAREGGAPIRH
jgi:tetratricopeptide (TPR) repeat protein